MGDGKDGGKKKKGKAEKPDLPKGAPQEIIDLVDCKAASLDLKKTTITWLPKKGIFEYSPDPDVSFKEGATAGSVDITVTMGLDTTIKASVNDAGQLEIDTRGSTIFNALDADIQAWVKQLNEWLNANGKKFGPLTVKDGVATLPKVATVAAAPAAGIKQEGLLPHVPVGEKVAALGVVALVSVGVVATLPDTEITTRQVPVAAAGATTAPPPPTDAPVDADPPVVLPQDEAEPVVYNGCFRLVHGAGASNIFAVLTISPEYDGEWTGVFTEGVGGPETGRGMVVDGRGEIDFPITQFGARDGLQLTAPDGVVIDPGPLTAMLPFVVTQDEVDCDPSTLELPPVPEPAGPTDASTTTVPASDRDTAAAAASPTRTVTEETKDPPWGLLVIPGTVLVLGGALALDERRRARQFRAQPEWG